METFTIMDGLILTIISMVVVFIVLSLIWGLIEVVAKLFHKQEEITAEMQPPILSESITPVKIEEHSKLLTSNTKHQKVAELMALILASENQQDKKFEIVETKRVK